MIPTDDEPAIGPAEPVEPTSPQPPAVTSSRPVTGLVALATSLLVLLVAIWWTGAAAPRVRVHHTSSSGEADPATGWAYASFEITNDGRFPVAANISAFVMPASSPARHGRKSACCSGKYARLPSIVTTRVLR